MIVATSQKSPLKGLESLVGTDKPIVVLMAGLPCTGKTTLAYALQDELRWLVVDKDWYKRRAIELRDRKMI